MLIFFLITILLLIGYYLWAIFFDKPAKTIELDRAEEDEVIEFTFDSPIKVSEQFINPSSPQETPQGAPEIQAPQANNNANLEAITQPSNQLITAEKETLEFNIPKVIESGKEIVSAISEALTLPSSLQSAEIEYLSFDVLGLSRQGRRMFSHIPF